MPRPVLQVVAVLLGLVALGGLGLGFVSAPERGRLPGEAARGGPSSAAIDAPDATPIIDAPPPPPPEKAEEEKEEEKEDEDADAKLVEKAPPPAPPPVVVPEPMEPIAPPPVEPEAPPPPAEIPPF
ncbi:hypothetical protein [Phenylobacterium sp.]|uniref:hypothetical protein n=1 Tax=Phenylobacterium sp. TaxID=1871053 RepID=UPI002E3400A6|nr:hypothetical protein [Phenylobacterium sp.]HEX2559380.1 hypothetical protein [Phenylobacterium sp.]